MFQNRGKNSSFLNYEFFHFAHEDLDTRGRCGAHGRDTVSTFNRERTHGKTWRIQLVICDVKDLRKIELKTQTKSMGVRLRVLWPTLDLGRPSLRRKVNKVFRKIKRLRPVSSSHYQDLGRPRLRLYRRTNTVLVVRGTLELDVTPKPTVRTFELVLRQRSQDGNKDI